VPPQTRKPGPPAFAAAGGTGFPAEGPGSVATFGRRLGAFFLDGIVADVISIVVLGGWKAGTEQNVVVLAAFLLLQFLFVWLAGQTPGMRVARIAVVRYADRRRQRPGWILARTLLVATIVPALLPDREGRCMHDRAAGTVMLQTR
jgi:uncharacterized RDD family membrane protein YckC